jgi:hypothetical protein
MRGRAFSLVEVVLVTAIMSAILLAVGLVMHSASSGLAVTVPENDLQAKMQRTVQEITEKYLLLDASSTQFPPTVAADGRWISYAVPVGVDASWGAGGTFAPRWGARLGASEWEGGLNAIVFERDHDVSEAAVVTGGLNINVNTEDAPDETDVFAVGHLVLVHDPDGSFPTMTNDERALAITRDWIVQVDDGTGDFGEDIDGDGSRDPIFALNGNTVQVNLWGLRVARQQKVPILVNERTSITLTNP